MHSGSMLSGILKRQVDVKDRLPRDLRRILYLGAWVAAAIGVWALAWYIRAYWPDNLDGHYYWVALHRKHLYTTGPMTVGAFLYSPAFAQAMWPLSRLPFVAFAIITWTVNGSLLAWLLRPLGWRWLIPLWLALSSEVFGGNIFIPLAATAALGFRYPAGWALSALTKVTPTVMPFWWLLRREWRPLTQWLVTTLILAAASAAIAPNLWLQWVTGMSRWATKSDQALGTTRMAPLVLRAPFGLALLVVGARRGWRWAVPVAALLCTPVFWLGSYAWLAALPRLQMGAGTPPTKSVRESAPSQEATLPSNSTFGAL